MRLNFVCLLRVCPSHCLMTFYLHILRPLCHSPSAPTSSLSLFLSLSLVFYVREIWILCVVRFLKHTPSKRTNPKGEAAAAKWEREREDEREYFIWVHEIPPSRVKKKTRKKCGGTKQTIIKTKTKKSAKQFSSVSRFKLLCLCALYSLRDLRIAEKGDG